MSVWDIERWLYREIGTNVQNRQTLANVVILLLPTFKKNGDPMLNEPAGSINSLPDVQ